MIDLNQFNYIKEKRGHYASWAIWAEASETRPTSNMGDLTAFDDSHILSTLPLLKNNVVMVGLNISVELNENKFVNFHGPGGGAFKIRYAFRNSPYYGAYMTDFIKLYDEVDSKKVTQYLKAHPDVVEKNVHEFREELKDLQAEAPTILAFGHDAYKLLRQNLYENEYSSLTKLTHYSHRVNKEMYKEIVSREIGVTW